MNYNTVINSVPRPEYKEKLITQYQGTKDIIADVLYCFKKYKGQAKQVAAKYRTGNIETDGRNIWQFIKDNIEYDAEPFEDQTSRSFARILHDKHGDCKHSTLIVSSIGWQMGYDVIFRFVKYIIEGVNGRKQALWHTYVILVDPKTGKRVIVDPLQDFNYEKPREQEINYIAKQTNTNMALTRLSGTQEMILSGNDYPDDDIVVIDSIGATMITLTSLAERDTMEGVGSLKSAFQKVKAKVKTVAAKAKTVVKTVAKKVGGAVKKVAQKVVPGVKKIALAPVRGAFDALLLLNFKGYATRLKAGYAKNPAKVNEFIKKFNWNPSKFMEIVNKGATKKAILSGVGEDSVYDIEMENGTVGVAVASAIAAASAAILAVIPVLKALGVGGDPAQDAADTNQAVKDLAKLPDVSGDPNASTEDILANAKPGNVLQNITSSISDAIKNYPIPVLLFVGGTGYLIYTKINKNKNKKGK